VIVTRAFELILTHHVPTFAETPVKRLSKTVICTVIFIKLHHTGKISANGNDVCMDADAGPHAEIFALFWLYKYN